MRPYGRDFCTHCDQIAKEIHTAGRHDFLGKLPAVLSLYGWQELEEERVECVGLGFNAESERLLTVYKYISQKQSSLAFVPVSATDFHLHISYN